MSLENHMVVNLDESINKSYIGSGDRCANCSDIILIEHVWNDNIVCSYCYWMFKEADDMALENKMTKTK